VNKIKYFVFKAEFGMFLDYETVFHIKSIFNKLGFGLLSKFKGNVSINVPIFKNKKQNMLLINCNLRLQLPVLNIKLRKQFLRGVNFYYIGAYALFNFYVRHISSKLKSVMLFFKGKSWVSTLDIDVISNVNIFPFMGYCKIKKYLSFMIVYPNIGVITAGSVLFDILRNYLEDRDVRYASIFNIGCDYLYYKLINSYKLLLLYVGHHDDFAAKISNVILPTTAIFETRLYFMDGNGQVKQFVAMKSKNTFVKYKFNFLRIFGKVGLLLKSD